MPFLESVRITYVALWPLFAVFIAYQLLIKSGLYEIYSDLDTPLHLLGAASVAWAVLVCLRYLRERRRAPALPFWIAVSLAVGATAIIGILWEGYEFLSNLWREWPLPEVSDTIKDLINDLIGSFVFAVLAARVFLKGYKR